MIAVIFFFLSLLNAPERVKSEACTAIGGAPLWYGGSCHQTLATCRDRDGWLTECPDSLHCEAPYVRCFPTIDGAERVDASKLGNSNIGDWP